MMVCGRCVVLLVWVVVVFGVIFELFGLEVYFV